MTDVIDTLDAEEEELGAFAGERAVVTGATSGIGRAIALGLADGAAEVCAVGRNEEALNSLGVEALPGPGDVVPIVADLTVDEDIDRLAAHILDAGAVDALVLAAGDMSMAPVASESVEALDRQYWTNVRAPFLLVQSLLPALIDSAGQVVFVNSTVVENSRPNVGSYATTKHGLRGLADSLRGEVNGRGVRVLSIYPGRTATPMQERIHAFEGATYRPERLIQPDDVASMVLAALTLPRTAEVTDIWLRPFAPPE